MSEYYAQKNKEVPTQFVNLAIGKCEDKEEFEELLTNIDKIHIEWLDFVDELINARKLTIADIAAGCNVSESTAKRMLKTIPSRRENVIKLACILGLNAEQTDHLLTSKANYQKLYAKNLDDLIWIYILKNGPCKYPDREFSELKNTYLMFADGEDEFTTGKDDIKTDYVGDIVSSVENKEKFIFYLNMFTPAFKNGYRKLSEHIDSLFAYKGASANTLFADKPAFLKLHYSQIEQLKKHECPSRTYLLVLGIHLGLSTDGINELLDMAGMGSISGKDKLEAAIYYFLEELNVYSPDAFFYPSAARPLYESCADLPELANSSTLINGVQVDEDTISSYIRMKLSEINYPLDSRIKLSRVLELL